LFESTNGYAGMWLVIGVPVLLAAVLLSQLEAGRPLRLRPRSHAQAITGPDRAEP